MAFGTPVGERDGTDDAAVEEVGTAVRVGVEVGTEVGNAAFVDALAAEVE